MLSPVLFLWRFFPCFAPRFAATPIATVSLELNCADFIEMLCTCPCVTTQGETIASVIVKVMR